jgi:hypothetical protein
VSPDHYHVSLRRPANHRCLYKILLTPDTFGARKTGLLVGVSLADLYSFTAWERLELLLHASLPAAPNASVGVAEHIRG